MKRKGLLAIALVLATFGVAVRSTVARAEGPPAWRTRYDRARDDLIEGRVEEAQRAFERLAAEAKSDGERTLAREMARLCAIYAERSATPNRPARAAARRTRNTDELTLLYASAFLYGAGTGTWFLLQVQPDSAVTATLPFAALTAAPVIAVATVDGYKKLPRGLPHAISAGLYLGLGEGIWLVGYQHGKAARIEGEDPASTVRWKPEAAASVLWGSATLGAVIGGVVGASLPTTPGRVSYTASTTMWAGAITGLGAAALLPDDAHRREQAFLAGGAGYNAGMLAGLFSAGVVSPSVSRVRLVDLLGIGGGLASAGFYLSIAGSPQTRATEGIAALGAAAGLGIGWLVTSGMPKDTTTNMAYRTRTVVVRPSLQPVPGGATLGLGGLL